MNKESVISLNAQAIEFANRGFFSEAIACLKRAISLEKYNHLLWFNLGMTYHDAGELKPAYHAFRQAYEINNEDENILEMLAIVSMNLGDNEASLEYCGQGIEINPLNAHFWNTIGVIYFNKGEYENAEQSFQEAVSINPYYYDALYNLRDTYETVGNKAGYEQCLAQMRTIKMPDNGKGETSNA